MSLTDRDRAMLNLAGQRWNYAGNLEQRVRDEFGISLTRFWQLVNRLLDREDALAHDPVVVHRLRRIRATRR